MAWLHRIIIRFGIKRYKKLLTTLRCLYYREQMFGFNPLLYVFVQLYLSERELTV
jgi:hypothetical protein